MAVVRCVDLVI